MHKLISIVLRTMAGLKATSSGRSLKPRIFGDFTRKFSKNGHLWGLAKMAPPCESPTSGFNIVEKTLESKPDTGAELIVLPCGGGRRRGSCVAGRRQDPRSGSMHFVKPADGSLQQRWITSRAMEEVNGRTPRCVDAEDRTIVLSEGDVKK
jgi:hypothetical protein